MHRSHRGCSAALDGRAGVAGWVMAPFRSWQSGAEPGHEEWSSMTRSTRLCSAGLTVLR